MRRRGWGVIGFFVVLLIIGFGYWRFAGQKKPVPTPQERPIAQARESVDLGHIPPTSAGLATVRETTAAFNDLPAWEHSRQLAKDWPHLSGDVAYFLRRTGELAPTDQVSRVQFRYGSLDAVEARDGVGRMRYGWFNDQLVAVVQIAGKVRPIVVIVSTMTVVALTPDQLQSLPLLWEQVPVEKFLITSRQGLAHHIDLPGAIDVSERFNLPLYRGKTKITPGEARGLPIHQRQVRVQVNEGDRFDLVNMDFTPAARRVAVVSAKYLPQPSRQSRQVRYNAPHHRKAMKRAASTANCP
jgi:hypothetical protein